MSSLSVLLVFHPLKVVINDSLLSLVLLEVSDDNLLPGFLLSFHLSVHLSHLFILVAKDVSFKIFEASSDSDHGLGSLDEDVLGVISNHVLSFDDPDDGDLHFVFVDDLSDDAVNLVVLGCLVSQKVFSDWFLSLLYHNCLYWLALDLNLRCLLRSLLNFNLRRG